MIFLGNWRMALWRNRMERRIIVNLGGIGRWEREGDLDLIGKILRNLETKNGARMIITKSTHIKAKNGTTRTKISRKDHSDLKYQEYVGILINFLFVNQNKFVNKLCPKSYYNLVMKNMPRKSNPHLRENK